MSQLTRMMEQVRKLKNGVGVQSLLDAAYKILGNPVVIFNTEYKLWAYTEAVTDDPYWNEIVTQGIFSEETQRLFGDEGFMEDVANAPRITLMTSEKFKYDRIAGKVFNNNNTFVSVLLVVACNKPFEENDAIVFEAICKLMTREIAQSEVYQNYEQAHQEVIIKSLIDERYDKQIDIPQVGILYGALDQNLYLAVVDVSLCNMENTDPAYCIEIFKRTKPAYKYAVYSKYVVIIISTNEESLNANKELRELINIFEQNNMYAGISGRFENLFDLKKHYIDAVKSLEYVVKCECSQKIFPYNASSMDTMKQIESLETGSGIQYFLDMAPDIFGNPVLFHDMELNLLGCTQNVEIKDPIWQELITYGTSSDETIELFRTTGMIDLMDSIKGGAFLCSDKIKYDRISWRIYNNDNIRIGCTSIVNTMKSFTEDELVLFGTFSQKFSKEIGKIEFYDNYGQIYSETMINRLISGKIDDYTFYSEDIGNLYDHLLENIHLLVIDTTLSDTAHTDLAYFRHLFNWPNAVNRFAIYNNQIIVIVSIDTIDLVSLNESNEYKELNRVFEQHNFYAGISGRFENINELQKRYLEAVNTLNAGIKNIERGSEQHIFQYGGIGH